ncbi:MAG TPA: histidine kinase dimerization/phospho-acceptor domain-containing protein, partial [Clostridia bacterium]|nr:histidine kinase dimerization/phospho-acceptor domain-containing protein [Clostridia bacterium]
MQNKISRQLTASVLLALAIASALYFTAQPLLEEAICRYYARHPNVVQNYTAQVLTSMQRFVRDNDVEATDAAELSLWVRQYPLSVLHIYRGESLLYDSTRFESSRLHTHTPTYSLSNNVSVHAIVFADGAASVSLTVFPEYGVIQRVNKVLLLIAGLVFLGILLWCIRRKLRYFMRLEQEVLSIAGGSLQTPISVHGQDELARLAECIDEMRDSLVSKLRREEARQQESYEWVTSLSHDLRTPLTMLTGYLEILRRRQPTPEQLTYLDKACGKA